MTRAESDLEIRVTSQIFEEIQRRSSQEFGRGVGDLSFHEASLLVGSILIASATDEISDGEGRVIASAKDDGQEALAGCARQMASEFAPQIDDNYELAISVMRDVTVWDVLCRREPRIQQTFRFRNDPPQYV